MRCSTFGCPNPAFQRREIASPRGPMYVPYCLICLHEIDNQRSVRNLEPYKLAPESPADVDTNEEPKQ